MRYLIHRLALCSFALAMVSSAPLALAADEPAPAVDREFLYDKVLGLLVGSAIGDAMGAPTEMWTRDQIRAEYGYVRELTTSMREPSPEGTWSLNLAPGGTTDDTRWKALAIDYLTGTGNKLSPRRPPFEASDFAHVLIDAFEGPIGELGRINANTLEPFNDAVMRGAWLVEWDAVARAYLSDDIDEYSEAINRFYGGEMVCAGLLFSSVIGAYFPGDPVAAYEQTYAIDVYDIGYAKDISSLTAAMIAQAIPPGATAESIMNVAREVDPRGYFKSRLVGRLAHAMLKDANTIAYEASRKQPTPGAASKIGMEPAFEAQLEEAYRRLDAMNQRMAFHAGEIHLVNLTALRFSEFDFRRAMEFVVNFGRDNDTTAAVTGAILGAYLGFDDLPGHWSHTTLEATKAIGFDLEALAKRLTNAIIERGR